MMASKNVAKRLDYEQDGEEYTPFERQKAAEEIGKQIRLLTDQLAKLQEGNGLPAAPYGTLRALSPLRNALSDDRMDMTQLTSSVVGKSVGQADCSRSQVPEVTQAEGF
jgi:hypothetical protein